MSSPFQVTIDCADPIRMIKFWAVALGYPAAPPLAGYGDWNAYWRQIGVPDNGLVVAGARRLRVLSPEGMDPYAVVMQDPEAKEFCLP